MKIGGIQAGRDASGNNHVDTKIVFLVDREKITGNLASCSYDRKRWAFG